MAEQQDYVGLKWVRSEIEELLTGARQALEKYLEEPRNSAHLSSCQNTFNRIHSTLLMLKQDGASRLALEMAQLTEATANNRVQASNTALECLMQAVLQLPEYLELTGSSGVDRPMLLLPLLNEMRSLRGDDPLPEATFFFPDLGDSIDPVSPEQIARLERSGLVPLLRKLRQKYQITLAGYLREQNRQQQLKIMGKIFAKLQDLLWGSPMAPLWEACVALSEGLEKGVIEQDLHAANLLRELDHQLRAFIEQGVSFINSPPEDELFRGLLYCIATIDSDSEPSDFTAALKARYKLEETLAESKRKQPSTFVGADTAEPVVFALKDELAGVRDALDLYQLAPETDPLILENQLPIIQQVADTLSILGLTSQRQTFLEQKEILKTVISTGVDDGHKLMDVATAILNLEVALDQYASGKSVAPAAGQPLLDEVYEAVIREARQSLELVKGSINDYVDSEHDGEYLNKIPDQLHAIYASLSMTPLATVADLVDRCSSHVREHWLENGQLPDQAALEQLADTVASIEYYLERLGDSGQGDLDAILAVAEESLDALLPAAPEVNEKTIESEETSYPDFKLDELSLVKTEVNEEVEEEADEKPALSVEPPELSLVSEPSVAKAELQLSLEEPDSPAAEATSSTRAVFTISDPADELESSTATIETVSRPATFNIDDPLTVTEEKPDVIEFEFNSPAVPEPAEPEPTFTAPAVSIETPSSVTLPPPATPEEQDLLFDDELLEVFIEEAEEVQAQLQTLIPRWLDEPDDKKALKDIRRAFHTLKGSGRMVGANIVGELAWSIENMLNRLVEGTISSGPFLQNLVERVTAMLPELIRDFSEQNQLLTSDVLLFMEQADAIARGEALPVTEEEADGEDDFFETLTLEEAEPEIQEDKADATLPEPELSVAQEQSEEEPETLYDTQLLDVFIPEARGHLATVQSFIDEVKARGGKIQISDAIQRALHTLKGTARMSEIQPLAELATAIERNIKDFRAQLVPADDRVVRMLEEGLLLINSGLEQLEASPREPDLDSEGYLSWLEAMYAQLLSEQQKKQETTRLHGIGQKAALFLTEDLELLLDADSYLSRWRQSLPIDELQLFRKELTTLMERASGARLHTLSELCEVLLDVCNYLDSHETHLPGLLAAPLSNGFEALVDMMNQVAAQQTPVSPQAVFKSLRESLEQLLLQDSQPPAETAAVSAEEASLTENPVSLDSIELEETVKAITTDEFSEDDISSSLENLEAESVEHALDELLAEIDDTELEIDETEQAEAAALAAESLEQTISETEQPTPAETERVIAETITPEPQAQTLSGPAPLNIEVEEHDKELLELFLEEAADLTEDCGQALEAWLGDLDNKTPLAELQRSLHTLKGGARMADQVELGDLSHALESVYELIADGRRNPGDAPLGLLQASHDQVESMLQAISQNQPAPSPVALINKLEEWSAGDNAVAAADSAVTTLPDYLGVSIATENGSLNEESDAELPTETDTLTPPEKTTPQIRVEGEVPLVSRVTAPLQTSLSNSPVSQTLPKTSEMVRVPAALIEQLINLSGESNIIRARVEQQISDVGQTLEEMDSTIDRVREQLKRLDFETQTQIRSTHEAESDSNPDFDPLEMDRYSELTQLSKSLVESATDLIDLRGAIQDKNRDTETLLLQQSRTQVDLQEKLMQARMVSFSRLVPRLRKITRQLSSELGKPVELNVTNAEGEMDRTMLERMLAPLEHMLRNAIGHGIEESTEHRLSQSKPATGQLSLAITRDGADIILELADDGRGIDTEAVRTRALEKHLIAPDDQLRPDELVQLVLEPGFSTADALTQISGRGVGLDVVNTEVRQMGGSIQIDNEPGQGTRFILRLPFTLSVNRALMVTAGSNLYALPMPTIDGIAMVAPETLADCYQNGKPLQYAGLEHRVMFLGELLGDSTPKIQSEPVPVVIVQRGGQNVALQVDEISGSREIVAKTLGPQFSGLSGVNGATILGNGRVVIIIDPAALIRRHRAAEHFIAQSTQEKPDTGVKTSVLVVDDSVTVRKVTSRLLTRQGYAVDSARDGVEAMAKLAEKVPDIILLDIEMPRMDGYEVASAIRNDPRLKSLPIIMVTSRTGEKHRARAFSLGVNDYIGKPYQEAHLLSTMEKLLG